MSAAAELAEKEVVERRDRLVGRRTELLRQRAAIISELRNIDHDLRDCEATARFFGLALEFPPDEREEYDRIRAAYREKELREREVARARILREEARQSVMQLDLVAEADFKELEPVSNQTKQVIKSDRGRPTVREVSLNLLEGAGSTGMKADRIREYLDRTYGLSVHEKTVGMTLYRLSRDGLVRRTGHTWFLVQPETEGKNPGVGAPGSVQEGT